MGSKTEFVSNAGYTSGNKATLDVKQRIWDEGTSLTFEETPVARYELFFEEGEVCLVKDGEEIVYSELLTEPASA